MSETVSIADTAPYCFLLRGSIFFAMVLLSVNQDILAEPILLAQTSCQYLPIDVHRLRSCANVLSFVWLRLHLATLWKIVCKTRSLRFSYPARLAPSTD